MILTGKWDSAIPRSFENAALIRVNTDVIVGRDRTNFPFRLDTNSVGPVAVILFSASPDTRLARLVSSVANEKGLEMKSSQPAARHCCRALWSGNAVVASMGMFR